MRQVSTPSKYVQKGGHSRNLARNGRMQLLQERIEYAFPWARLSIE